MKIMKVIAAIFLLTGVLFIIDGQLDEIRWQKSHKEFQEQLKITEEAIENYRGSLNQ